MRNAVVFIDVKSIKCSIAKRKFTVSNTHIYIHMTHTSAHSQCTDNILILSHTHNHTIPK